MPIAPQQFLQSVQESLRDNTFIKLNLSVYQGREPALKSLFLKRVIIKRQEKLSFLYRYKTRDITKNYALAEALSLLDELLSADQFRFAHLFTLSQDVKLEFAKEEFVLKAEKPSLSELPSLAHDKIKNRKIAAQGTPYLHALKITDAQGNVYKNAQDKYRQINHYIEILSSLLKNLPTRSTTNIVDMGSGKGYLTFALYDYLNNNLEKPANVTGVEFRKDLVDLCNAIARDSGFEKLSFEEGTIENYAPPEKIDVLIALHACDTATDEAIYQGITHDADLIVVAPCCHKQIRREMERHKAQNELDFLTKHGIFLERQAEMVTDGLRSLMLEYYGYSTKVFEFVSDAHTPKNVLVVGEKRRNNAPDQKAIFEKIQSTKGFFGIRRHYLEVLLGWESGI